MADALSPTMTLRDFENGYWYLEQLKNFAERIGIPAAKKLRKDELEKAIVAFLRTGKAALPTKRSLRKTGVKDVERGLNLKLRIENYTSNRETKDFIVEQAHLMAPEVREKSGVWYRLNRWREEQITSGKHPTYGDLVRQYIALNKMERFEKIPHGRYINFVAEFLAADKGVTRAEAIAAWTELKELDVPKDYASWVKARGGPSARIRTRSSRARRACGCRGGRRRWRGWRRPRRPSRPWTGSPGRRRRFEHDHDARTAHDVDLAVARHGRREVVVDGDRAGGPASSPRRWPASKVRQDAAVVDHVQRSPR